MAATDVIRKADDVVFQNLGGDEGAVLLHMGSGQYHTLNPMGARIWEILENPVSEPELTRMIEAEFDTGDEPVGQDVRAFVQDLLARRLVQLDPEA